MSASAGPAGGPDTSPHAERRAETIRIFQVMVQLAPDDPRRAKLRDGVIEDHMPYARHIAERYAGRPGQFDDLAQVAYLGLVKAADNFDPEYGTAFLGYATVMIIGEIKRYFRDLTWDVHVTRRGTRGRRRSAAWPGVRASLGRP